MHWASGSTASKIDLPVFLDLGQPRPGRLRRCRLPLSDVDRKLLEVFCSNIAVGFENVQLYQKVYDLAFEDLLVRLPNRNSFIGLIECRPASADCVALVDIDGFSDINSILDQAFGDQVLEAVATACAMRSRCRLPLRVGSDVFGLLGGAGELTPERIAQIFACRFQSMTRSCACRPPAA
jgi:predicted signal transduction protein with EAL and GGDEF domain